MKCKTKGDAKPQQIIGGTRNAPNPPKYLLNKEHVFEVKLHNPIKTINNNLLIQEMNSN